MEDLQEEYRPGCGPHKRYEKKDFEAVAKLLMKEKTFTSAFIQKSLAMSYFKAAGSHTPKCRYDTAPAAWPPRPLRIRHRKRMHLTIALQAGEGSAEVKQLRLRVCKEEI